MACSGLSSRRAGAPSFACSCGAEAWLPFSVSDPYTQHQTRAFTCHSAGLEKGVTSARHAGAHRVEGGVAQQQRDPHRAAGSGLGTSWVRSSSPPTASSLIYHPMLRARGFECRGLQQGDGGAPSRRMTRSRELGESDGQHHVAGARSPSRHGLSRSIRSQARVRDCTRRPPPSRSS
jgi:hypothetical protein